MSSIKATAIDNSSSRLITSDPGGGGGSSTTDNDEIKIFECEKHEEDIDIDGNDNSDRLSPVIKEEEVRKTKFFFSKNILKSKYLFFSHHP